METGTQDSWEWDAPYEDWETWEWAEPPVGRIGAHVTAAGGALAVAATGGALLPIVGPSVAGMYAAGEIVDMGHERMATAKWEEANTGRPTSGKVKIGLAVSLIGCALGGLVALGVLAFGMGM